MHKITTDLRDRLKPLYTAKQGKPAIIDIPKLKFLAIDGEGEPGGPAFQEAIGAMYGSAFTIKFALKKSGGPEYRMMPLEGLWSCADPTIPLDELMKSKSTWSWTLLIAQPEEVDRAVLKAAQKELAARGKKGAERVRLETFAEGKCVQILHVGPYSEEIPTFEAMHAFARESGYEFHGKHHEIYLSDPSRCAPEKIKTILRMPVRKAK